MSVDDAAIERELRAQLTARGPEKTICPSDVARAFGATEAEWRPLMEPVREVARRLADAGQVEWSQSGRRVDPRGVRGHVRLRLPREPGGP